MGNSVFDSIHTSNHPLPGLRYAHLGRSGALLSSRWKWLLLEKLEVVGVGLLALFLWDA